eukprot:121594_1
MPAERPLKKTNTPKMMATLTHGISLVLSILSITHGQPPSNDPIVNGLPASAFNASSEYDHNYAAENARYFEPVPTDIESRSWAPLDTNVDGETPYSWLQIDLGKCYTITDVGTKGNFDYDEWTTQYILSYSTDDPNNLLFYNGIPGAITGNIDNNTQVFGVDSTIHPSFIARYVRFTPILWSIWPSMRVELYGFQNPSCTATPPLEPCLCSDGVTLGEVIRSGRPNDIFDANMVDNNEINNEINNDGLNEKYNTDQIDVKINFNNLTMIYVWIIVVGISMSIAIACWLLRSRNRN